MTTQKDMVPLGGPVKSIEGPLVVYRGHFRTISGRILAGRVLDDRHIYSEVAANNRTDKVYVIMFESPMDKWEADREIAETMTNGRRLSPNF